MFHILPLPMVPLSLSGTHTDHCIDTRCLHPTCGLGGGFCSSANRVCKMPVQTQTQPKQITTITQLLSPPHVENLRESGEM